MKRVLSLRIFWVLLALLLTFFVSRVVLFTEDVSNFIQEVWD